MSIKCLGQRPIALWTKITKKKHWIVDISPQGGEGFTLIELIVVIAMIAILTLALFLTFNPIAQFNKARDGQREHDLQQMQAALDTYYNDNNCYPQSLSNLNPKYMQKLPTDPDGKLPYVYQNDGTSCPQWNVLYAALQAPEVPQNPCPLTTRTSCLPEDYSTSGYNYCVLSGSVYCPFIATSTIGSQSGGGSSGGGSGGASNNNPTPTPYGITCSSGYYGCTGNSSCNSINPYEGVCAGHGGNLQCYCDSLCRVNGVKQCAH